MPTTYRIPARIARVCIVSILVVAGCSSGDAIGSAESSVANVTTTESSSKPVVVHIRNDAFVPAKTTVAAGSTITFVNDDEVAHTGTDTKGAFDTGPIAPGASKTVTVKATKTGAVPYLCSIHRFMRGTVEVAK